MNRSQSFSTATSRASTTGFETKSRRTRNLRKFNSMNGSTRRFQPVVKKYVPQEDAVDDDATVLTELSILSSQNSSFNFDDSMSLGKFLDSSSSLNRSSSRCSFTPASGDDSFDWEDLQDDDDLTFLSLSVRPVEKKNTTTKSQKNEEKKNADDAVKAFMKDRMNIFQKNMDFLARKFEWKN